MIYAAVMIILFTLSMGLTLTAISLATDHRRTVDFYKTYVIPYIPAATKCMARIFYILAKYIHLASNEMLIMSGETPGITAVHSCKCDKKEKDNERDQ